MTRDLSNAFLWRMTAVVLASLLTLSLIGCSEEQGETQRMDREADVTLPATNTDRDPTPQSGTGGERQNASPFGTTK